jgi:hypothetical protein
LKLPMGVRAAPAMTTTVMVTLLDMGRFYYGAGGTLAVKTP